VLVQVTLLPTFTVNVAGEKAKLAMVTVLPDVVDEDVADEVGLDEQAIKITTNDKMMAIGKNRKNLQKEVFIRILP
jgi:hypothetical protein